MSCRTRAMGDEEDDLNTPDSHRNTNLYIIYSGLVAVVILGNIFQTVLFFSFCTRAANYIHQNMLLSVLSAPMSFFQSTDCGKLNFD